MIMSESKCVQSKYSELALSAVTQINFEVMNSCTNLQHSVPDEQLPRLIRCRRPLPSVRG